MGTENSKNISTKAMAESMAVIVIFHTSLCFVGFADVAFLVLIVKTLLFILYFSYRKKP